MKIIKKPNRLAFSLIELSVVILVIGILVIGITQGARIIGEAKLKSARALTSASPVASTSGLVTWLDASSASSFNSGETKDGTSISVWNGINPQTSTNFTLQGGATKKASYVKNGIGGLPTLYFDANSSSTTGGVYTMAHNPNMNTENFTILIVMQPMEKFTSSARFVLHSQTNFVGGYSLWSSNTPVTPQWNFQVDTTSTQSVLSGDALIYNKPLILTMVRTNTNNTLYYNGLNPDTTARTYTQNPSASFFIGCQGPSSSSCFDGYISEIIYFNRVLKNQELLDINSYLSQKYSI